MVSRTFGQLKATLAQVCGTSGMPVNDPRVMIRTNEAIQELMNEGAWAGVVDRWHLLARNGSIVLPPQFDMLLEFTADGVPQQLVSPWGEFVNYGPGIQEDLLSPSSNLGLGYGGGNFRRQWWQCGGGNLYDRGESPVAVDIPVSEGSSCVCSDGTGAAWSGPWVIRQYANPNTNEAAGAYSTIQGLDPDGLIIRSEISSGSGIDSEWIDGVRVEITSGSSYVETTQQFSKITAYTKPETNGYVRITAWNGITEVELSNYEPWQTQPSFHRYFSPFLEARRCQDDPCTRVVLARVRKRFVPITEDSSVLIISNVLALKCMLVAAWKREAGNLDEYAAQKLTAVDILRKESSVYRGKMRTPAISVQRGFSIGALPAIR